jgi:hypothetical protein
VLALNKTKIWLVFASPEMNESIVSTLLKATRAHNCKTKNEFSLISTDDEGSDNTNTVLKHKRNDPT